MAVTRLKRKGRRNIVVAKGKVQSIQRLNAVPVIKKVDIEQLKEEYKAKAEKAPKKEVKAEAPKDAVVEAPEKEAAPKKKAAPKKEATAKTEDKPVAKKAAAKKAAPKKED
jgi:hypothetical protein